jgi:hypothetical protein
MVLWHILWYFDIFYGYVVFLWLFGIFYGYWVYSMVIWYIFYRFGMLNQKNLATLTQPLNAARLLMPHGGHHHRSQTASKWFSP